LRRRSSSSLDDYIEAIRSSDLVISSGGGFLTDAFPWQVDGVHCTFMLAKKFGKPFALMGQGIGPLDGHRLRTLTREFLTDAGLIGLREGVGGTSILKELGITGDKVIVTGDDAVQLGYSRHKPVVGDGLGINIRLASYSRVKPEDVNRLRTILRDIVKELGTSFVPLPVALDFEGGDPTSISRLISTEDEQSDGGLALTEPLDLVERVSRCRTVITGSYHAAVFALSQGIPIIGLVMSPYYQYKFAGLSQLFPGGCTVVTLDDPDLAGALLRAVETNWATAAERRAALLGHAERQVNLGNAAYERLYALAG
jgi:colanic acid/amylovoran biosynthesis protein